MQFKKEIAAPVDKVWNTMLASESYTEWTAPFMAGSHFKGSWDQGERIHFLAPNGEGMCADIESNRLHEEIVIKHVGVVKEGGVEDTTSDDVKAWAPAYEKFFFASTDSGTEVTIEQDLPENMQESMTATWNKSLDILKGLCESS